MNNYFVFVNETDGTVNQVIEQTIIYQEGALIGETYIHSYQSDKPSTELVELLYFKNGNLLEKPIKPSEYHTWNITLEQYEVTESTLNKLRSEKKTLIDNRRQDFSDSLIQYGLYFWDADSVAIKNINGKLQEIAAKEALGITIDINTLFWRDGLNNFRTWSTVVEYKTWLQGLVIAIAERTTTYYTKAWIKKAEIGSLSTLEDILSYDITTGWNQ